MIVPVFLRLICLIAFLLPFYISALSTPSTTTEIIVCTNKYCTEKGADATMSTFNYFCPNEISVRSIKCLGRCNKGPNVRIVLNGKPTIHESVRSVEAVVTLLQDIVGVSVNLTAAEVLRLNYDGNLQLSEGNVDEAIKCYDAALNLGDIDQEGVLRVMRGTALLQRAYTLRTRHRNILTFTQEILPTARDIQLFLFDSLEHFPLNFRSAFGTQILVRINKLFSSLDNFPKWNEKRNKWPNTEGPVVLTGKELIDKAALTLSLYEYSLMLSLEDLLLSTIVLPDFGQSWRRAGDALMELNRFKAAIEYYETAMRVDESLIPTLLPAIERLKVMERLLENAEAKGWPVEEMLSLIEEK